MDKPETQTNGANCWRKRIVFGVQVESKIQILQLAKNYNLEYIAMQTKAIDDDCLHATLNAV